MPDIVNSQQPASGGSCTAATNYLARTSGGNEGGNSANITTLICGLVTDGVITGNLSGATGGCGSYLDAFYLGAQQNTDRRLAKYMWNDLWANTQWRNIHVVLGLVSLWRGPVSTPGSTQRLRRARIMSKTARP